MPFWSTKRAVPVEIEQDWRGALPVGASRRALGASRTAGGWLVVSATHLSVRGEDSPWTHHAWHEIEHGGWNVELVKLQWTRTDGRRGSAHLADPGPIPGLFRERVKASIVFQATVPYTEAGGIVVSARRNLAEPAAPLLWNTSLQRGLSWQQPGVRELADESLERFRDEFDPS